MRLPKLNVTGHEFERYQKAINYLDGLANLPLDHDYMRDQKTPWVYLERTQHFLDRLGNPEKKFKYVHVTGTSGKGTVVTMVQEAMLHAGKRVGAFTSPYVTSATEKIRVNDLYISGNEFADIVDELKPHIEEEYLKGPYGRPTYFEVFFAIALLYFKRQKCEWVVLEVGAGGRYDATNVIQAPAVTAITSIDYDHVDILGKTLLSIANNKAGIIKKSSTFFTTEKRPVLLKLFKRTCDRFGVSFTSIAPSGDYQEDNKALARAICRALKLPDAPIERGIRAAKLPCRFEIMNGRPVVVLDGAHNGAKMRSTVANLKNLTYKKLHLVIGLKARKDARVVLKEIVPFADRVYVTRFQAANVECIDPKVLMSQTKKFLKSRALSVHLDPDDALAEALAKASPHDLVLVTGSFYLAGELRRKWYSEKRVLENRRSFR